MESIWILVSYCGNPLLNHGWFTSLGGAVEKALEIRKEVLLEREQSEVLSADWMKAAIVPDAATSRRFKDVLVYPSKAARITSGGSEKWYDSIVDLTPYGV